MITFPLSISSQATEVKILKQTTQKDESKFLILFVKSGRIAEFGAFHYNGRDHICVSCQTGCAMGCRFCATGTLCFSQVENLAWEEIVAATKLVKEISFPTSFDVVASFMGQGEPTSNPIQVARAMYAIADEFHLALSTIGRIEPLKRLQTQFKIYELTPDMQISLHYIERRKRELYMPGTKGQITSEVFRLLENYAEEYETKIRVNYVPFKGINDSQEEMEKLAKFISSHPNFYLKLGEANPFYNPHYKMWFLPSKKNCYEILRNKIPVKKFHSQGSALWIGCGQMIALPVD